MREVREETVYDVELGRLLGEDSFVVPAGERPDGSERPRGLISVADVPGLERVSLVDAALGLAQR